MFYLIDIHHGSTRGAYKMYYHILSPKSDDICLHACYKFCNITSFIHHSKINNKIISSKFIMLTYNNHTLSSRIGKVVASHAEGGCEIEPRLWLSCTDLYYARGTQEVLPMRVGGATSQLDLQSLTSLSVAGCVRLQLGVPHWATSVDYCR